MKPAFFYKNQLLNAPALTVISSLSGLILRKSYSVIEYMMTKTTTANNLTHLQGSLNIRTAYISNYPITTDTQTLLTSSMSWINTSLEKIFTTIFQLKKQKLNSTLINKIRKKSSFFNNNSTIEQLKRKIDILQHELKKIHLF